MHYGQTRNVLGSKGVGSSVFIKGNMNDSHLGEMRPSFASSGQLSSYWSIWLTLIVVGVIKQPLSDFLTFNINLMQNVCYCNKGVDQMLD